MQSLQELGLTKNEEKAYISLLELGEALAGKIATRAKIHRRNAYDTLNALVEKGLISYVLKGKRKLYRPVDPHRIVQLQKERLALAQEALPSLLTTFQQAAPDQQVMVLEGIGGMKTFQVDFVEGIGDRFLLGATGSAYAMLPQFLEQTYRPIKRRLGVIRILWTHDATHKKELMNLFQSKSRTLPKAYSSPTQIFIYRNRTAIAIWSKRPIVIVITGKNFQDGFKKYFEALWKMCA